jgi:hypothetical protein
MSVRLLFGKKPTRRLLGLVDLIGSKEAHKLGGQPALPQSRPFQAVVAVYLILRTVLDGVECGEDRLIFSASSRATVPEGNVKVSNVHSNSGVTGTEDGVRMAASRSRDLLLVFSGI